jgi:hypothetical protein
MSQTNIIYRVEHPKDNRGIFWSQYYHKWTRNGKKAHLIRQNFLNVRVLTDEFPEKVEGRNIQDYKCAFSSISNLLYILDTELLAYLVNCGFCLVEIKAPKVVHGRTQAIFVDENVKRNTLTVDKLLNKHAKQIAKEHLKEEFKTLNEKNYIIYN